jgi:hypothetical protein
MARYASWVHGNAVKMQYPGGAGLEFTAGHRMDQVDRHAWTDVVGFPTGPGGVFRGQGNDSNWFHVAIPTPPLLPGKPRSRLEAVFVLFSSDPFVEVAEVLAFDGPNPLPVQMNSPSGLSGRHGGTRGLADLADGQTRFPIEGRPEVLWGVGISVRVSFGRPGQITFTTAGADFFVPD